MHIRIKESRKRPIHLLIPNTLFFNKGIAYFAAKGDYGLTYGQAWNLLREIKSFRRRNGKWTLVEVQSADGDEVKIVI